MRKQTLAEGNSYVWHKSGDTDAFCGISKIISIQQDLGVSFSQECAITRQDARVCKERGNHVNKVTPRKRVNVGTENCCYS